MILQLLIVAICGCLHREQADLIAFLREENRVLKARLGNQRLRFDDDERRRLGELGQRLGRRLLAQVATVVTPDTILRWHRALVARKWTYGGARRAALAYRLTFEDLWFGWRPRIRPGAIRGFRAP